MAVFSLNDLRVIWANQIFFNMCGVSGSRFEARLDTLVPEFSAKWLLEGKTQSPDLLAINGRKYQIHGNIIRPGEEQEEPGHGFMGIAYWVDVTEYDDVRIKYEESRPVVGVLIIDNYDELIRNQPERVKNDLRDAVEDQINQYWEGRDAVLRRYDRDRYASSCLKSATLKRCAQTSFHCSSRRTRSPAPPESTPRSRWAWDATAAAWGKLAVRLSGGRDGAVPRRRPGGHKEQVQL